MYMANFTLLLPLANRKEEKTSRRAEVNKNSLFAVFQIPTEDLTHFMHTHAACMCTQPAADLQKNNKKKKMPTESQCKQNSPENYHINLPKSQILFKY